MIFLTLDSHGLTEQAMISILHRRQKTAIRQTSNAKTVLWLALVSRFGLGYFFVSLVALHFLRTEYNPLSQTVSQYAVGPYGYFMTAAFYALGVGVLALALGLLQSVSPPPRIGSSLLGVAAMAVVFVGIFPVDRGFEAMPATEYVHDTALMIGFLSTLGAMITLSGRFAQDARWRSMGRISMALSFAAVIEFVVFIGLRNTLWIGVIQRAAIATILLWQFIAASQMSFVAAGTESSHVDSEGLSIGKSEHPSILE